MLLSFVYVFLCCVQVEELQSQKGTQTAVEARASALDEKYAKLKSVYTKLREEHIELLRTNGEVKKNLAVLVEKENEFDDKLKVGEQQCEMLLSTVCVREVQWNPEWRTF